VCEVLPDISSGRVVLTGTFIRALARYSCDIGYFMVGNGKRNCGADGQWDGSEPLCRSESVFCVHTLTFEITKETEHGMLLYYDLHSHG